MATSVLQTTNLDFRSGGNTQAKVTATASTLTFEGTSSGSCLLSGLSTPVSNSDAATKAYVDSVAVGLSWKDSVVAATTANGTLATSFANGQTIDGVTLATGDRILIKNQTTGAENGIYTVNASGAPSRASDLPAGSGAAGAAVFVHQGTSNADQGWVCTNDPGSDVVGTDALTFTQFTGQATPGGSSGTVQYNSGGSFAGISTLSSNGTNLTLSGGQFNCNDSSAIALGSSQDFTIEHNGTNTIGTSATGDFIIDNTNTTGMTIMRLGSNTGATNFEVRNDSDAAVFSVSGVGTLTNLGQVVGRSRVVEAIDPTTISTASNVTYSAADLFSGVILRDPNGAARSDTTPTAANIVSAVSNASANSSFGFTIVNTADAAETITLSAGTGVTLSGTMTVEQNERRSFLVVVTNATASSEAVTIYNVSTTFGSGASPGGSDTQIQYNSSGSFAGAAQITTDGSVLAFSDSGSIQLGSGADATVSHNGTTFAATNSTGDMLFDNTGTTASINLRLGTDTSATSVQVRNNSDAAVMTVDATGALDVSGAANFNDTTASTSTTTGAVIVDGGLGVAGAIFFGGAINGTEFVSTSDATLKTDIAPISDPLAKLRQVEAVQYRFTPDFKPDDHMHYGVLAQNLQSAGLGHMVHTNSNGTLAVDYNNLVGLLIGAVKELQAKVDGLAQ